jgi:hypothetical protein
MNAAHRRSMFMFVHRSHARLAVGRRRAPDPMPVQCRAPRREHDRQQRYSAEHRHEWNQQAAKPEVLQKLHGDHEQGEHSQPDGKAA